MPVIWKSAGKEGGRESLESPGGHRHLVTYCNYIITGFFQFLGDTALPLPGCRICLTGSHWLLR